MIKPWLVLFIIVTGLLLLAVQLNRQTGVSAVSAELETLPATNSSGQRVPVIVELFTSEGCSSCPPADAVLAKLERTQPAPGAEIIALGEHVDYWNYIGWSDPFSSPQFSERQGAYARAFNRDGVYTPQMVVDGETEFVGSNLSRAREAIAKAAAHQKATVQITRRAASDAGVAAFRVRVTDMPPLSRAETVEVMLAITESDLASNVARGENAGRRLEHGSVMRLLALAAQAAAHESQAITAEPEVRLKPEWKRENLRAVAFVQAQTSRRVLGAAAVRLSGE
ncbi:MAG TPA: DUF1223 domain-containing protein [Blastocatellia bacterium]|nr:DUF1223 domain-containing protein [Blastocatellia bacterium]